MVIIMKVFLEKFGCVASFGGTLGSIASNP